MKSFISFLLVVSLLLLLGVVSVAAVDVTVDDDTSGTGTSQNGSFWQMIVQNHIAGHETVLDSMLQYVAGKACGEICSVSADGLHHCNGFDIVTQDRDGNKCYRAICTECNEYFYCYDGDFNDAYSSSLVADAGGVSSTGHYLVLNRVGSDGLYYYDVYGHNYSGDYTDYSSIKTYLTTLSDTKTLCAEIVCNKLSVYDASKLFFSPVITVPFDGVWTSYCIVDSVSSNASFSDPFNFICHYNNKIDLTSYSESFCYSKTKSTKGDLYSGETFKFWVVAGASVSEAYANSMTYVYHHYEVAGKPVSPINTPSSPGGLTFDVQIDNTTHNIQFVDEVNNRFFDTTTNTWVSYDSFDYDYDQRAYTFYLDTGETVNITYGDEYISYVTGGNTYNYYYTTIVNNGDEDSSTEDDEESGDVLSWLKKIYNAIKGIDTGDDFDLTINNITEGEQDSESFFDGFKLRLQWIRDVYEIAQSLLGAAAADAQAAYTYADDLDTYGADAVGTYSGGPSIYLDLGAANSRYGYEYGGTCVAIDFSWFAAYKPTVDSITGGFLWLLYLWGLVKHVPSILSGMGITENRIDDISRQAYVSRMKVGKK